MLCITLGLALSRLWEDLGVRLLENKSVCPPDGFRYVDPLTGHEVRAITFPDWVEAAIEHRKANNLPVPYDHEAVMQDQLCSTIPPEYCSYQKEGTWVNLRLTVGDVISVTKSLLDAARGFYVEQSEAERRAEICSRCFLNVHVQGCGACHQIAEYIAKDRSTSRDNELKNCGVCACYLKPKVHIRLTTLENTLTNSRQELYPSFCWLKKNGPNYHREDQVS